MRWEKYLDFRATSQHVAVHNMRRYVDETWSESGGRVGWIKTYGIGVRPTPNWP